MDGPEDQDREEEAPRLVEAELVGHETEPLPLFREGGILARMAFAFLLGTLGLGIIAIGVFLTLTIIGALFGIPLILFGLLLAGAAFLTAIGGGRVSILSKPKHGKIMFPGKK